MSIKSVFVITTIIALSWPVISKAQTDSSGSISFRIELGAGISKAGEGGGFNGRLAMMCLFENWGGIVRMTAHDGGEGETVGGFFGHYEPVEKFYDSAALLSYVLMQAESIRIISSVGLGAFWGDRLSEDQTDLIEIEKIPGFAFELSFSSAGSTIGIALSLLGNVNAESSVYGVTVSFTLGS